MNKITYIFNLDICSVFSGTVYTAAGLGLTAPTQRNEGCFPITFKELRVFKGFHSLTFLTTTCSLGLIIKASLSSSSSIWTV